MNHIVSLTRPSVCSNIQLRKKRFSTSKNFKSFSPVSNTHFGFITAVVWFESEEFTFVLYSMWLFKKNDVKSQVPKNAAVMSRQQTVSPLQPVRISLSFGHRTARLSVEGVEIIKQIPTLTPQTASIIAIGGYVSVSWALFYLYKKKMFSIDWKTRVNFWISLKGNRNPGSTNGLITFLHCVTPGLWSPMIFFSPKIKYRFFSSF